MVDRGLLACFVSSSGCAWHLPKLRHNTAFEVRPKSLDDQRDQATGAAGSMSPWGSDLV